MPEPVAASPPTIGEHLTTMRKARKLTQADVGVLVGYTQAGVSQIECGTTELRTAALIQWLDALDATRAERMAIFGIPAPDPAPTTP